MSELKKDGTHTHDLVLEELKNINADPVSMEEFNKMPKNEKERYVADRVFAHYIEQKKDGPGLTNNRARVRTLSPSTIHRPNGFIENSIIVTILVLATILGLIIGSIAALYK